jgi:hypothetical protein
MKRDNVSSEIKDKWKMCPEFGDTNSKQSHGYVLKKWKYGEL